MRILIATTNRTVVGGVERYVQRLIPALRNDGHDVALFYENPFNPAMEMVDSLAPGLPVWRHETGSHGDHLAAIAAWAPDVVYSQCLEDQNVEAALMERYPVVLYAHNYYGTCLSGAKCHLFP